MVNFVDILLLIILITSVINGWRRGFILGILNLARWVGSLIIGLWLYPYVANIIESAFDWQSIWLLPVSFLVVTFIASILLHYLGSLILERLSPSIHSRKLNQILGLVTGLLSGVITVAIVSVLLLAIPLPGSFDTTVEDSRIANRFAVYTDKAETALAPVFENATKRNLNKLTVEPGSEKTIELPYKVENSKPQPELEEQMLEMINKERLANGLDPLEPDTALRTVARKHSADMFRRGYFSHYSPEGETVSDRIRSAGIRFIAAGENLALAPSLTIAHEGLMNSPGHRANILQKRYGRVGIGIMRGGLGQLMITQNFKN